MQTNTENCSVVLKTLVLVPSASTSSRVLEDEIKVLCGSKRSRYISKSYIVRRNREDMQGLVERQDWVQNLLIDVSVRFYF